MSLTDVPINYTSRMSLNWFSLLTLQWMNYGLLCIAMVVNSLAVKRYPDLVKVISFEEQLPSHQEALVQLNMIWNKVAQDCNLTTDKRDILISSCIQNLYKV